MELSGQNSYQETPSVGGNAKYSGSEGGPEIGHNFLEGRSTHLILALGREAGDGANQGYVGRACL